MGESRFRFTAASRRHKITRADVRHAIDNSVFDGPFTAPNGGSGAWVIGPAVDGIEIEIGLVLEHVDTDAVAWFRVIHAMPVNRKDRR